MLVIVVVSGEQDSFDCSLGLISQVVPGIDIIPQGYQRQDIGPCDDRKTELLPALALAVLPDPGEGFPEPCPFAGRELLPFSPRRMAYPLQRILDCLVPVEQETPSPQVILGGGGHTFFESIRVPDDKLT